MVEAGGRINPSLMPAVMLYFDPGVAIVCGLPGSWDISVSCGAVWRYRTLSFGALGPLPRG